MALRAALCFDSEAEMLAPNRNGLRKEGGMGTYAKRTFAATATATLLALAAAGTASADPSTAPGPGGGSCLGQPGQSGLVQTAQASGKLPGNLQSLETTPWHGQ